MVTLTTTQWDEAERIVRDARTSGSGYVANWKNDLDRMRAAGRFGVPDSRRVISDLWWKRSGIEHFASIKTVKPNIDQTAQAKLDLLHLAAEDEDRAVHFGLYYNPFGDTREDYSWSPPSRLFDLANDQPILIGADYWDALGGDGTYEEILQLAAEAGIEARPDVIRYGDAVAADYEGTLPEVVPDRL